MEKYKNDGNKLFTQKRYFEALDTYNKGLQTVTASIINHLKQKSRELLENGRPSSALLCAVAVNRLVGPEEDVEALLLYAECLVHFDDLLDNALLVCLKVLVDDNNNNNDDAKGFSRDAIRVLKTCFDVDAERKEKERKEKKAAEIAEGPTMNGRAGRDDIEADCGTNGESKFDDAQMEKTISGGETISGETRVSTTKTISRDKTVDILDGIGAPPSTTQTSSKPLSTSSFSASSPSSPSSTSSSSSPSSSPASEHPMARVWGTQIPLKNCLDDLSLIASSFSDPEDSGAVIGAILANAAASELALRQPHLAAASAAAALVFLTNKAIKTKAAFRLTSALVMSCSFSQAMESLLLLSSLQIDAKEVTRLKESLTLRQLESRDGQFDWESHIRWTKENPGQDLDCASFVGPLEIAEIPLKGCGLRATRDVKRGEALIVDHAYFACHRSNITHLMKGIFERVAADRLKQFENSKTLFFLTDGMHPRDLRPTSPLHVLSYPRLPLPLLPHQMLQLQHDEALDDLLAAAATGNIDAVMENLNLIKRSTNGLPTIPSQFKTNEEKMTFGEKLVGIVNTNMMHHAQASCPWHVLESQEDAALSRYSTDGLWVLPSFLNTGSKTNIIAICLGDVLVCKAATDIKKGEELLINYTIEREWSKREEFMDHHGIPMPPDPDSSLTAKVDQIKKIDSKLEEISNLMRHKRYSEALKALNSLEKKNKDLISQDLIGSDLLFKKAKCQSLTGNSPSQVLPVLQSALEAERKFRPYGSDYIPLVLQWTHFPNLKTEEQNYLKIILEDLSFFTFGCSYEYMTELLDTSWN